MALNDKAQFIQYQHITGMNFEDLAQLLFDFGKEENPAVRWLEETYCKSCPTTKVTLPYLKDNKEQDWYDCEFEGICPHYKTDLDLITLWLKSEVRP